MKIPARKSADKIQLDLSGFSLVELVIIIGMISSLSVLILPSGLNWVRVERVNSYTRELKEYLRVVRLEARRWSANCFIDLNPIGYNSVPKDKNYYGFSVSCSNSNNPNSSYYRASTIGSLVPAINNSIFQVINKNFQVTPNGRISSNTSIVIIIGSKYHNNGPNILNCLVIQSPTGHINQGKYSEKNWISSNMAVSQVNDSDIITASNCKSS